MTTPSLFSRVVNRLSIRTQPDDHRAIHTLDLVRSIGIPGWSQPMHYAFFEACLLELKPDARILVCGVYHGLDLYLLTQASKFTRKPIKLTGVDLFSTEPMADWTPEQKAKGTWEANGFGPSPSMGAAMGTVPSAAIIKARAADFMRSHQGSFDMIYLDTSHDYATVKEEIQAAVPILAEGGILCGDDYNQPGAGWGVDAAVCEQLPAHVALWNRIWISP